MTIQLEGYDEPLDGFHFRDDEGGHVFVLASEAETARDADDLIDACQAIAEYRLAQRRAAEAAQRTEREQARRVPLQAIETAVRARMSADEEPE